MAVQCPKCVLRFDSKPMLADHMTNDHAVSPEGLAALQPESVRVGMADAETLDATVDRVTRRPRPRDGDA